MSHYYLVSYCLDAINKTLKMLYLLLLVTVFSPTLSLNVTENENLNKTKRTLNHQLHNPGENKPLYVFVDNLASQSSNNNEGFSFYTTNKPYQFISSPKVAAQQVLYEFQQTPSNVVSNVHVKQLFQPLSDAENANFQQNQHSSTEESTPNHFAASETVVNPVQHSVYTNHDQNYAHQLNYHPLYNVGTHNIQSPQQYVPGKYLYVNGKIAYQPNNNQNNPQLTPPATSHPIVHPHNQFYQKNLRFPAGASHSQAYQQNQQKSPLISFGNRLPQQKLIPPPAAAPMHYSRFIPPQKHQLQQITHPMPTSPPVPAAVEEQNEEEDDEENAPLQESEEEVEDDDEDNEEKSNYQEGDEEEEHDRHPAFGKYTFDEEEEDNEDHRDYRKHEEEAEEEPEENEEDSRRGSSRHVKIRKTPKNKANPNKYNYSYSEGYSTSSKYQDPGKSSKNKKGKKPIKKQYKSKYSKGFKPKIEGRYSENIPVTHKHKVFKEKWYVTKTDNLERSSEDI